MFLVAFCKMTTFIYLAFVVLSFSLPLVGLAQNTSTGTTNASKQNMTTALNLTNASCKSDLRISKLAVENILRLSHHYATHVIEIKISINSGNETRELKWSWADEIGRTIISLSLKTSHSQVFDLPISPFYFVTLNPGIKDVNVVVENYGCLPNGSNGSEVIFDFLLLQLFRSDDIDDYKLCRVINGNDDIKQHNCCSVASGGNLTICDEYFSILLEYAKYYIFAMVFIMCYVGFPLILQHLQSIPKETEHYSITDSPMALSRIFYSVFLEGSNNPVTPYYRRLTFSLAVVVIIYIGTSSLRWIIVSLTWALFFTAYDIFRLNRRATKNIKMYLLIFTLPLNIKHWWKCFKRLTNQEQTEQSTSVPRQGIPNREPSHEKHTESSCIEMCGKITTQFFKALVFVIAYIVCFTPMCIFSIAYQLTALHNFSLREVIRLGARYNMCVLHSISQLYGAALLFSCMIIFLVLQCFLNLLLYFIIGLYLNGSLFSPIVVPVMIFFVYFWKNWRSFVETKYLQLKTAIYECCEEYYEKKSSEKKKENEESKRDASEPTTSSLIIEITNHQESDETTDDSNESYVVNVKEGRVSKALYDKIREYKLPYNEVLFYFSMRMFFMVNFCLTVFVMMSIAQKSNIDVPVQIMSTIAVSTFPLIFETIWADHSFEQKNVNHKKLKQELSSIMKMTTKTDDIVNVQVKFKERITEVKDYLKYFYNSKY